LRCGAVVDLDDGASAADSAGIDAKDLDWSPPFLRRSSLNGPVASMIHFGVMWFCESPTVR
jgi:hypothetical protein